MFRSFMGVEGLKKLHGKIIVKLYRVRAHFGDKNPLAANM